MESGPADMGNRASKEVEAVPAEHLVESHEEVEAKHEAHGASLAETVEHDKAIPDDR